MAASTLHKSELSVWEGADKKIAAAPASKNPTMTAAHASGTRRMSGNSSGERMGAVGSAFAGV